MALTKFIVVWSCNEKTTRGVIYGVGEDIRELLVRQDYKV